MRFCTECSECEEMADSNRIMLCLTKKVFLTAIFFCLLSLCVCNSCRKKEKETVPSQIKGVPVHPRSTSVKVVEDRENHLEIHLEVNHSLHHVAAYYRTVLGNQKFQIVEDMQHQDRSRLVGIRGREHLQVDFAPRPGGLEVKLLKRLIRTDDHEGSLPPTPEDVFLPEEIKWDRRIFAASGDDVALRGHCDCTLEAANELMKKALEKNGWNVRFGKGLEDPDVQRRTVDGAGSILIMAEKTDRKLRVVFDKISEQATAVRIVLSAMEYTGDSGPDATVEKKEKDPIPENIDSRERKEIDNTALDADLQIKMEEHWQEVGSEHDNLTGFQKSFLTEKKDLELLAKELQRVFQKRGWKVLGGVSGIDLADDKGRLMIFSKGKKSLSAQLTATSSGTRLILSVGGD